jgi:hypothetical protein
MTAADMMGREGECGSPIHPCSLEPFTLARQQCGILHSGRCAIHAVSRTVQCKGGGGEEAISWPDNDSSNHHFTQGCQEQALVNLQVAKFQTGLEREKNV